VGVATRGSTDIEIDSYVEQMLILLKDPDLSARCRQVAEEVFNLNHAVERLTKIYDSLTY
jgi:hypothetical protein